METRGFIGRVLRVPVSAHGTLLAAGAVIACGLAVAVAGAAGLWLVLVGSVLVAVRHHVRESLSVTVADVMTHPGVVAPGWLTVEAFLEDYRHARGASVLPVTRFSGEIDGVVSWARLADVPDTRKPLTRVSDLASPLNEVVTATPRQDLSDLRHRLSGTVDDPVLVFDHGRLVGFVAPADLSLATERRPAPERLR